MNKGREPLTQLHLKQALMAKSADFWVPGREWA